MSAHPVFFGGPATQNLVARVDAPSILRPQMHTISAEQTLVLLRQRSKGLIDVRSPSEFLRAGIPGFANVPILDDSEREQVGLCFRKQGREAAIALGQQLTSQSRRERLERWVEIFKQAAPELGIVTCWRGGLRSQFAVRWLAEAGVDVGRVSGGYRAMRRRLLSAFCPPPDLLVITGYTGSGKTELLRKLEVPKVDLEGLGNHRGSSFGSHFDAAQPRQTWFENAIALELMDRDARFLVEDESATLGQLSLPAPLKEKMRHSPVVVVDEPLAARVDRVYREYVARPLAHGVPRGTLLSSLESSLLRLQRRLGGGATQQIHSQLMRAGAASDERGHEGWIAALLTQYYDKAYQHALNRQVRPVVFRGSLAECGEWLTGQRQAMVDRTIGNPI